MFWGTKEPGRGLSAHDDRNSPDGEKLSCTVLYSTVHTQEFRYTRMVIHGRGEDPLRGRSS